MCLCHGTMGNLMILRKLEEYVNAGIQKEAESQVSARVKTWLSKDVHLIPQEYHSPGFMTGVSGIGYYLLRGLDKELPDVLEL